MSLTNNTDISQSHKGAFNNFWSFMGKVIFEGIPIFFLYLIGYVTFIAAVMFQPILLRAMVIRPDANNNTPDPDEQTNNERSIYVSFIAAAKSLNRAFAGKNERAYIIARALGYIGGFAAGGHIINNMDNDGSPEFALKSMLVFDGITFASTVAGNYVLGKPLEICVHSKQCPQILTRFKDLRSSELLITSNEETDELMPINERQDDSQRDLEASTLSRDSDSTLSFTGS